MIYVLYHGNCYDGFGAAYAAWKSLGSKAKYIPVTYGALPPNMPDAESVYIVDFSYPRRTLEMIADSVEHLVVLDHHKTAKEDLESWTHPNATVIFDMEKSGALLTWEYFHRDYSNRPPQDSVPHEAPDLIKHISDRDLWTFKMPGSKEVHSALVSLPFDFEVWDKLKVEELIVEGKACLRFEESVVKKICDKAWIGRVGEYEVPIVNTAAHWSEVGHQLLQDYPGKPFVASFTVMKSSVMWSLRSRDDFDVSEIAKKFGGGGHKNASGFKTAKF